MKTPTLVETDLNNTNDSTVNIFAYGSNLHSRRMQERVASANPIAIGFVRQRRIAFHKRSVDGSAKADAFSTDNTADRVWGVVYEIDIGDKPVLDEYEFLGTGYDIEQVEVVTQNGIGVGALAYIARADQVDGLLKPYSWYVDFVVQGAKHHRLPLCYIKDQLCVESLPDPNQGRHQSNSTVLRG